MNVNFNCKQEQQAFMMQIVSTPLPTLCMLKKSKYDNIANVLPLICQLLRIH